MRYRASEKQEENESSLLGFRILTRGRDLRSSEKRQSRIMYGDSCRNDDLREEKLKLHVLASFFLKQVL